MRTLAGKPKMLREVNSSIIEDLVFENGPISKPELARQTGLSLPTINKLVDDLEKNARLSSIGRTGKGAGRKAMLYETNRNSGCLLVCYFKEGSFLCRLVDMLNNTIFEESFPLDSSSRKKAIDSIFYAIDSLKKKAPAQIKIIGVGLPGVILQSGHLLGIPQISVWEGLNLGKTLNARYKTTVFVENNVKLSAVGYFCIHSKGKQNNLVYLYVGNGIGSGIIIDKQLYMGQGNFSGEISFMAEPYSMEERNYVASSGYMESLISHLVNYNTGKLKQRENSKHREKLITILSAIAVNHVAIVNPSLIVFAGKIFDKNLVEAISQRMMNRLPPEIMPGITMDLSEKTGLEGLIHSCRGFINTGMHLIRSTGLPQRAKRKAI